MTNGGPAVGPDDGAKYRALVDFFPYGVVLTREGVIVEANPAALRLCGAANERDVLGRDWREFVDTRYTELFETGRARLRRGEAVEPVEFLMKRVDGTTFFAEAQAQPLRAGATMHVMTTFREVTDIRAALAAHAESDARFRGVIETAVDGIVLIDAKGIIQLINPAAAGLFGHASEDVVGRNVRMLMPDRYSRAHDGYIANYLATGDAKIIGTGRSVEGLRRDGTTFPMHLSVGETVVGGERFFTGIVRDETARVEAERMRAESEARFRGVIETAVDGIVLIDAKGIIQLINPAAARLFGYTSDDVTGRNVRMLMPTRYSVAHDGYIANYLTTGDAKIIGTGRSVEGLRRDGTTFPMHLSVGETVVGGERFFTGIVRDETARVEAARLLAESEETYHRLSYMSPAAVIVHVDGRIVFANLTASHLLDVGESDGLVGRNMIDFYQEDDRPIVVEQRGQIRSGERREIRGTEVRMIGTGGRPVFAEVSAARVSWGGMEAVLLVVMDLTERKRAELALRKSNDELRRSNEELARFAYVASHDLKEPLRMVSSYCDLIDSRYSELLDEDGRQFIYYAVDGATRMQRLIDDLLEYSRIGRGRGGPERCALGDVVRSALENLQAAIDETDARIAVRDLPEVTVFRSEFVQLFQNLIGNAIKFRGTAAPVVEVRSERDGDDWTISVRDNGIGIDPRFAERVFGVFQRLHTREAYPGTGIGLAICEKVVVQNGGKIWVEAGEDGGSVFRFTVPG